MYIKKLEEQFKQLDAQIDKLAEFADKAKENVKSEYLKQIELLRTKEKIIKDKLHNVKKSSAIAWTNIKEGAISTANQLKKTLDQVMSRQRGKNA